METKIEKSDESSPVAHCVLYERGDIHLTNKGTFLKDVLNVVPAGQLQAQLFPDEQVLVISRLRPSKLPENL